MSKKSYKEIKSMTKADKADYAAWRKKHGHEPFNEESPGFEFTHEVENKDGEAETIKFKVGSGPDFYDNPHKYLKNIPNEKLKQRGVLTEIENAPFEFEMPFPPDSDKEKKVVRRKRMSKPKYEKWCEVYAVLTNRHEELVESQPVNVSKLLNDPELLKAADCGEHGSKRSLRNDIKAYCEQHNIELIKQEDGQKGRQQEGSPGGFGRD